MIWLVLWLYVLAFGVWLGSVVCVSCVVAPALFGGLPVESAGAAMGLVFSGYYVLGYAAGAVVVATAAALRRHTRPSGGTWLAAAWIAALALLATLYAGLIVYPAAAALRPQLHQERVPPAVRIEFDALHDRAVQLNGAVLVAQLMLAGILGAQLRGAAVAPRRLSRFGSELLS